MNDDPTTEGNARRATLQLPAEKCPQEVLPRGLTRFNAFALVCGLLILAFSRPIYDLVRYALGEELHSHAVLIPFVAAFLAFQRRDRTSSAFNRRPEFNWWGVVPLTVGLISLGVRWAFAGNPALEINDSLALTIFAFYCLLWSAALFLLGGSVSRAYAFPAAFLVFIVPMPSLLRQGIDAFFQHTSADAASMMFAFSSMPVFREGTVFHLPGIVLEVAEECSGIRSSLVLFITSLVAGDMFLKSPWKRAVLTCFVIPLAIFRNGFRIFTIALLCVKVDPGMINSAIHNRGGPLFFALSLIPLFLVLVWLRRTERDRRAHPALDSEYAKEPDDCASLST